MYGATPQRELVMDGQGTAQMVGESSRSPQRRKKGDDAGGERGSWAPLATTRSTLDECTKGSKYI